MSSSKEIDVLAKFLVKLSFSKKYHDGFNVLDDKLRVIGICRLLLFKPMVRAKLNENRGVRFNISKLLSLQRYVKFVGIIESDIKAFYFVK